MSNYQEAKRYLKEISYLVKTSHKGDKPAIRMIINNCANWCNNDYQLTEHQKNLLANYACKLHPKD